MKNKRYSGLNIINEHIVLDYQLSSIEDWKI